MKIRQRGSHWNIFKHCGNYSLRNQVQFKHTLDSPHLKMTDLGYYGIKTEKDYIYYSVAV